jgi:hypothetical protein
MQKFLPGFKMPGRFNTEPGWLLDLIGLMAGHKKYHEGFTR